MNIKIEYLIYNNYKYLGKNFNQIYEIDNNNDNNRPSMKYLYSLKYKYIVYYYGNIEIFNKNEINLEKLFFDIKKEFISFEYINNLTLENTVFYCWIHNYLTILSLNKIDLNKLKNIWEDRNKYFNISNPYKILSFEEYLIKEIIE